MAFVAEIIRDLLVFVAVMFALLIVLIVVVSKLPSDNPLKHILSMLSYRIGVTLGAGIVAIPVEPILGLDALYDVAVPVGLIWYWLTFFREAVQVMKGTARSKNSAHDIQTRTSKSLEHLHSRF